MRGFLGLPTRRLCPLPWLMAAALACAPDLAWSQVMPTADTAEDPDLLQPEGAGTPGQDRGPGGEV